MTKYNSEFKAKVVNRYLKGDIGYVDLCAKYKIADKWSVMDWDNRAKIHGLGSLKVRHPK